jgi:hypothetical protein
VWRSLFVDNQGVLEFERSGMNFPNDTERLAIVGTTGSGKTHAALWHLARRNYDEKPWVVYDWKLDEFINSLPGSFELDVNAPAPEHPGLYIVHPIPDDDDEAVDRQMTEIWKAEDIGVFVDEGHMVARGNKGFRKLLTQGRSKHIPMIVASQRPVWLDRFVLSESEYKQVFRLQHSGDIDKMEEYVPFDLSRMLQKRWSYYYDAAENKLDVMRPVPDQNAIRSMFAAKLARLKKVV